MIQIPIEIGDVIRVGRFKNKKITVKEIGVDENNHPTVNGRGILKVRIEKLMPPKQENKMNITEQELEQDLIQNVIDTYNHTKSGKMALGGKREASKYEKISKKTGFITVYSSGYNNYAVEMTEKGIKHFNLKRKNEMKVSETKKLDKLIEKILRESEDETRFEPGKDGINVKFKQEDKKWNIVSEDTDEVIGNNCYETKEEAEQAALIKGFNFKGSNEINEVEPERLTTKREKTPDVDKVETIKLDKEKEIKLEILRIAKKIIKEELKKKINEFDIQDEHSTINLTDIKLIPKTELNVNEADVTDRPDLEVKAKRYAQLANKMKELEAELKLMEKEYVELDNEFRPLLENIGKTKDTFIRAGKLLIKIEREGYEKGSASYKTGFEYLYNKVNGTMKDLANEALKMTQSVSYVKSKIAVVNSEGLIKEENWFTKIKSFLSNKIKKLFGLNKQANDQLTQLEKLI